MVWFLRPAGPARGERPGPVPARRAPAPGRGSFAGVAPGLIVPRRANAETRGMSSKAQNAMMTERPGSRSHTAMADTPIPAAPGRVLAPALATGVLWWACHFPLNWSWLAWVALVPLLTLVRSPARPARIYLAAWLGGMVFYWAVIQWMRYADFRMYFTWAALATYCALYVPLTIFLVRRLEAHTRWPLTLTFPLVWTALEYLRAHFGTGFPWYFLAHT